MVKTDTRTPPGAFHAGQDNSTWVRRLTVPLTGITGELVQRVGSNPATFPRRPYLGSVQAGQFDVMQTIPRNEIISDERDHTLALRMAADRRIVLN